MLVVIVATSRTNLGLFLPKKVISIAPKKGERTIMDKMGNIIYKIQMIKIKTPKPIPIK